MGGRPYQLHRRYRQVVPYLAFVLDLRVPPRGNVSIHQIVTNSKRHYRTDAPRSDSNPRSARSNDVMFEHRPRQPRSIHSAILHSQDSVGRRHPPITMFRMAIVPDQRHFPRLSNPNHRISTGAIQAKPASRSEKPWSSPWTRQPAQPLFPQARSYPRILLVSTTDVTARCMQ